MLLLLFSSYLIYSLAGNLLFILWSFIQSNLQDYNIAFNRYNMISITNISIRGIKDYFVTRNLILMGVIWRLPSVTSQIPIPFIGTITFKKYAFTFLLRNILFNLNKILILCIILSPASNMSRLPHSYNIVLNLFCWWHIIIGWTSGERHHWQQGEKNRRKCKI